MKAAARWLGLVALAAVLLQLFFVARIAAMAVLAPESTAFQRSEAWRAEQQGRLGRWRQAWVPYAELPDTLKRAVIASEDAGFATHGGVDWDAIRQAWHGNERAARRAAVREPRIRGGSTITQQLAKNLLLSGERTLLRKGQELVLAQWLEAFLSKRRILELYLNSVEWGEGVFGAEAAAQRYYGKPAARLSAAEAARLAVMLPRPRYFEKRPDSAYVASRSAVIVARMGAVQSP
ncbi:monofunctional biosynthetic peptidoglycan transglycosylase [Xylophilus sp. ASV27]|uniref:monofunctional biosynthetic peptidoglycan transglycosylase n=1 Tax=Xylophilus sp. ASV27 TaxID=2795129 RepID=UPI0018EA5FB9|nr:monofunctional biosynthetic peptidoglycan transglycosylase [Xylophilus sp. ASV27]